MLNFIPKSKIIPWFFIYLKLEGVEKSPQMSALKSGIDFENAEGVGKILMQNST